MTDKIYHTSISDALADGWIHPYFGGYEKNKAHVYGKKAGNHRVFRCYKLNSEVKNGRD